MIQPPKKFLTTDGKQYDVAFQSKFVQVPVITGPPLNFFVQINLPANVTNPDFQLLVKENRKFVPIAYTIAWLDPNTGDTRGFTTVYFFGQFKGSINNTNLLPAIAKMGCYSNQVTPQGPIIDHFNFVYNCYYDQVKLAASDFVDPSNGVTLFPTENQQFATSQAPLSIGPGNPNFPVGGAIFLSITFTYFYLDGK